MLVYQRVLSMYKGSEQGDQQVSQLNSRNKAMRPGLRCNNSTSSTMTHQQNQKKVWDRLRPVKSQDFLEQMKEILQKQNASAKIEKQLKMADFHNQWPFQDPRLYFHKYGLIWYSTFILGSWNSHFHKATLHFVKKRKNVASGFVGDRSPVQIDLTGWRFRGEKNGDVTVVQQVSDALTQQYLQDAPLKNMCFETFNCRCIHHKSSSCCSSNRNVSQIQCQPQF